MPHYLGYVHSLRVLLTIVCLSSFAPAEPFSEQPLGPIRRACEHALAAHQSASQLSDRSSLLEAVTQIQQSATSASQFAKDKQRLPVIRFSDGLAYCFSTRWATYDRYSQEGLAAIQARMQILARRLNEGESVYAHKAHNLEDILGVVRHMASNTQWNRFQNVVQRAERQAHWTDNDVYPLMYVPITSVLAAATVWFTTPLAIPLLEQDPKTLQSFWQFRIFLTGVSFLAGGAVQLIRHQQSKPFDKKAAIRRKLSPIVYEGDSAPKEAREELTQMEQLLFSPINEEPGARHIQLVSFDSDQTGEQFDFIFDGRKNTLYSLHWLFDEERPTVLQRESFPIEERITVLAEKEPKLGILQRFLP